MPDKPPSTQYRLYADGTVVHEDDFREYDNSIPFYDDYGEYDVPDDPLLMVSLGIKKELPSGLVLHILYLEMESTACTTSTNN